MSVPTASSRHSASMRQLNSFLTSLRIPIHLQSPTELTPSLLVAILEILLPERVRYDVASDTPENINLQNTKIFLGVLGDYLKRDVGLSNIDPRQLANGGIEECNHVAQILCWIGRSLQYIVGDDTVEMHAETPSISPSTSITTKASFTMSNLSMHYVSDSDTSISNIPPSPTPKVTPRAIPLEPRPRCIHEVASPILGSSFNVVDSTTTETESLGSLSRKTVRRTGYISPVDEGLELLTFEQSRSLSSTSTCNRSHDSQGDRSFSLAALQESTARTLRLDQECARFLARLRNQESQSIFSGLSIQSPLSFGKPALRDRTARSCVFHAPPYIG